jgi:hypothetical protein
MSLADRFEKRPARSVEAIDAVGCVLGGGRDADGIEIEVVRMAKQMAKPLELPDVSHRVNAMRPIVRRCLRPRASGGCGR